MADNPLNLALRFVLEVAGLFALGYWGWANHDGVLGLVWSVGLVVGAASVWAVFRVPGDGGPPVVVTPGWARLLIEAVYFSAATVALLASGQRTAGIVFAAVVVAHYAISYDRLKRLLAR
jgi:hypothetical protein